MVDNTELAQELETLKGRLQMLEDKEAIRELLSRYSFNSDLNRIDNFLSLWTEDCTFSTNAVGGLDVFKGKDEIRAHTLDPRWQSVVTLGAQHLLLDFIINIDGDGELVKK